ncbi:MAG TPA: haloacid dehalogenase-like hydrolase [Gaiellaceae bacterium]|jgi:2-hydroxy-3-keto-5-methylthiopentenyl-1-phosphate phosphatase|nr:haloacid dehalogenase-like hydrolase [Gaiellaceae bacterium]
MRLVLDWDGTVTERDTLDLVLQEFGDAEIYERVEDELERGTMTLNEVIAAEFATVTAPLDEVVPYVLEHARVRPGFAELARAHRPLVVSSGFHELIEPVLEREGVKNAVELRANRVEARPDGWLVDFRVSEECEVCGEPCKRGDLPAGEVVYAGDGHSDYCVSLAASRVFATGSLAGWLERRGVAFTPLTDFRGLASEL